MEFYDSDSDYDSDCSYDSENIGENTQFWFENPIHLLSDTNLIPNSYSSLEEQLNSVTRAILLLWGALYSLDYKYHSVFLYISLAFIIILYYIQRNMIKESYCEKQNVSMSCAQSPASTTNTIPIADVKYFPTPQNIKIQSPSQYRFFEDSYQAGYDQSFKSPNQALAGPANPKTRAPVPVIPPPADFQYWSEDYVVPQGINDQTNEDLYLSGYVDPYSNCGNTQNLTFTPQSFTDTQTTAVAPMQHSIRNTTAYRQSNYNMSGVQSSIQPSYTPIQNNQIKENFNTLYPKQPLQKSIDEHSWINQNGTDGDMIDFTYNPQQMLQHNLPSNLPSGQCQQDNAFNTYNKNLFTQILSPNQVYMRNETIEPIQSNIGISFNQQFEPVSCQKSVDGKGTTYISHDPRIIAPTNNQMIHPQKPQPTNSNTYDPRFHGYGTSYRAYIDEMSGQPRFFYDDVDVVRRPNYIARSNIDHAPWAHSYGPISADKSNGPIPNHFSHALANTQFLNDSLQQREELQTRLMRKYNTQVGWQRRQAPLRRDNGGTMNTCKL